MLDWIIEKYFAVLKSVPALFVAEDSLNFVLVRAMIGLILLVLVLYLVSTRPFRSAVAHCLEKAASFFAGKR